jgi:hypothetical protein
VGPRRSCSAWAVRLDENGQGHGVFQPYQALVPVTASSARVLFLARRVEIRYSCAPRAKNFIHSVTLSCHGRAWQCKSDGECGTGEVVCDDRSTPNASDVALAARSMARLIRCAICRNMHLLRGQQACCRMLRACRVPGGDPRPSIRRHGRPSRCLDTTRSVPRNLLNQRLTNSVNRTAPSHDSICSPHALEQLLRVPADEGTQSFLHAERGAAPPVVTSASRHA